MTDDVQQFLATVGIFSNLEPVELALVAELAEEVVWEAGDEAYAAGDEGSSMIVVRFLPISQSNMTLYTRQQKLSTSRVLLSH